MVFNPQADVRAVNVRTSAEGNTFDVEIAGWMTGGDDETIRDIFLPMLGDHNVLNSLASLTIAHENGCACRDDERRDEKLQWGEGAALPKQAKVMELLLLMTMAITQSRSRLC